MASRGGGRGAAVDVIDPSITCQVKTLEDGDGVHSPAKGAMVLLEFEIRLPDGTKIDSTTDRRQPLEARLGSGQLIRGLERTIPKMTVGQRSLVTVPPELAYGTKGFPPIVPPYTPLLVDLKLVSFEARTGAESDDEDGEEGGEGAGEDGDSEESEDIADDQGDEEAEDGSGEA